MWSTRTPGLDGCKQHPIVGARASVQAPSGMSSASTGLQTAASGKAKSWEQKGPASPSPRSVTAGTTRPLTPASPSSARHESHSLFAGTAFELRRQHHKVLVHFCAHPACGIVNTRRVYVGPTAHGGDSSVPPTLVQRRVSGAALSLQLGPRERNKGAIFISSLARSRERAREQTSVCKTQQSAGNFPPAFFFFPLFLFLKRGDIASGQFKDNQALASHVCHTPSFLDSCSSPTIRAL